MFVSNKTAILKANNDHFTSRNVTCVWQPVESFTMVFASAALVVKQWKKEGMMLQQPMASISWLGRTV